jgi:hypothetical protein
MSRCLRDEEWGHPPDGMGKHPSSPDGAQVQFIEWSITILSLLVGSKIWAVRSQFFTDSQ